LPLRSLHIAMITSAPLPPCEGLGIYVWSLARQLTCQGQVVHLITRGSYWPAPPQQVDGITIWQPFFLPVYPFHVHLHSLFVNHLVKRIDPQVDIYHLHTPLVAVPATTKKILLTVHTPLSADARSIQEMNWLSLLVKLQLPVSIHLEKQLINRSNRLVAVSRSVATELREYGVDPSHVTVLGNGVDIQLFHPTNQKLITIPRYFLAAGRLGLRKGLEDFIRCAEIVIHEHPHVQFWVAGDGPLRHKLECLIKQLGLSAHVRLLGHISDRHSMVGLYQQAVGFIHPAHYEGLPTVLLEAMACGCPVVATAVSGALDVVQDGVNGLLVPAHDPQIMALAVNRLLEQPQLVKNIREAARQTIVNHFAWGKIASKYIEQYQRLLQGHSDCLAK
jgi:glycosyltransferase involved in cell wall biosynthesis